MDVRAIIIMGTTLDGRRFRPSDWTDRLYYAVASYEPDGRIQFNPLLSIRMRGDDRCIEVDLRLRESDPVIFSFITGFARDNALQTLDEHDQPVSVH